MLPAIIGQGPGYGLLQGNVTRYRYGVEGGSCKRLCRALCHTSIVVAIHLHAAIDDVGDIDVMGSVEHQIVCFTELAIFHAGATE